MGSTPGHVFKIRSTFLNSKEGHGTRTNQGPLEERLPAEVIGQGAGDQREEDGRDGAEKLRRQQEVVDPSEDITLQWSSAFYSLNTIRLYLS